MKSKRSATGVIAGVITLGLVAGLLACSEQGSSRESDQASGQTGSDVARVGITTREAGEERARSIGRRASTQLSLQLQKKLMTAISQGPVHAIDVCSLEGLATAESLSTRLDARVRRVSERYRNPADRPDPLEASVLKAFEARPDVEDTVLALVEPDGEGSSPGGYLYMKPIRLSNSRCLDCHGKPEDLGTEVEEVLARLYPEDKAVGFALGDLRGAFSVRVPAEP